MRTASEPFLSEHLGMGGMLHFACRLLVLDRAEFLTMPVGITFCIFRIMISSPGVSSAERGRRALRMGTLDIP